VFTRAGHPASLAATLLAAVLLLLGLSGCGGPAAPAPPALPPAADLLARSAAAMATVKTAAIDLQVDQGLNTLPVRSASGKLSAAGDATGTATVSMGTSPVEMQFVITAGSLFLKGPTGRFQRLPLTFAASIFDPTALLNPNRGVAALLRTATQGNTEAEEAVNGAPAYRVRANFDPNLVGAMVPGLSGTNSGLVWIDKASSRLVKAQLDVPVSPNGPESEQAPELDGPSGHAPGTPTAPVTVTMSDFDAPLTVSPPA
jgi:lipoprotein LprG